MLFLLLLACASTPIPTEAEATPTGDPIGGPPDPDPTFAETYCTALQECTPDEYTQDYALHPELCLVDAAEAQDDYPACGAPTVWLDAVIGLPCEDLLPDGAGTPEQALDRWCEGDR